MTLEKKDAPKTFMHFHARSAFGSGGAPLLDDAKTLIYATTAPELENLSGKYLVNNRLASSSNITYNKKVQKKL